MLYVAVGGAFDYAYRLTECFEHRVRLPVSVPHYRRSSVRRRDLQSKIIYSEFTDDQPNGGILFSLGIPTTDRSKEVV